MNKQKYIKQVRQYKYISILGKGAFATVYLAEKDNQQYAIKEIKTECFEDENADKLQQYFEQEIDIYKNTNHLNLVKLFEEFRDDTTIYCVFEYCSKGDLNDFLKKNKLQEEEIKTLFTQVLAGMKYLYSKNIVHRDLKLDNILIDDQNIIKIADFGFAKYGGNGAIFTSYCGTPATMAPEVLCNQNYDYKCDIWSLGVILFYMIYKKYHWQGNIKSITDLQVALTKFKICYYDNLFKLSAQGKDILAKMLIPQKEARINYDDLFAHPWLEGKLDEKENLLQSQYIIQKAQQVDIPQLIGYALHDLRCFKNNFLNLLGDFVKQTKNEEAKQSFQGLIKKVQSLQFHAILVCNDVKFEENHPIFDYKHELYHLLKEMYISCRINNKETVLIEDQLIQFLNKNKLSNKILFELPKESPKTLEELQNIHKMIAVQQKTQEAPQLDWSAVTQDDELLYKPVENAFEWRKRFWDAENVQNYHNKHFIDHPLKQY